MSRENRPDPDDLFKIRIVPDHRGPAFALAAALGFLIFFVASFFIALYCSSTSSKPVEDIADGLLQGRPREVGRLRKPNEMMPCG